MITKNNINTFIVMETYSERIKDSKDPAKIRLRILEYLFECKNLSETSRVFNVSRKTIRKWEIRYYEKRAEGLKDTSRAPKSSPRKTSDAIRDLIIDIKLKHPEYGVRRIKKILELEYNVHISIHPIYNELKSRNLIER